MPKLLIATTNAGKIKEFEVLFQGLDIELVGLKSVLDLQVVPETGQTFSENALIKARGYAAQSNLMTLAEDSGLCCDALEGAPGVYSARFAGADCSDEDNNAKLLKLLESLPVNCRGAHYESHIAIVSASGDLIGACSGRVVGVIHAAPIGDKGFGYDPLFFYPPFQKTFAQVELSEKNKVSHRFHAMQKAKKILAGYLNLKN
jgi:XTP/dITP diphosphohydrolase